MEARNNEVFIDSNFFIALLNSKDSLHEKAGAMSKELAERGVSYVISNLVFLETVTVASMRAGRETAVWGGERILNSSRVRAVHIDEALHAETWSIFQRIQRKDTSFVDCSTIAVMKSEDISTLLTFDTADFKPLQEEYHFSIYE